MTPRTDTRPYCAKHETHYSALNPCVGCADDPAPPVAVEAEAPADPRLLEIERFARENAAILAERGRQRLKQRKEDRDKDSIGESTMVKLFDCAAKWTNIEIELVEARAKRQYMRDLMEHEQHMAGVRKAH